MFTLTLLASTLLCSLVAGFLFAYAIVIMPGIRALNHHDYLQAFKVTDAVIQNNSPLFILVWLGSVLSIIAAAVLGIWNLPVFDTLLLAAACAVYLFGVQLPTIKNNIPLNNELKNLNLQEASESELNDLRQRFEKQWVASNNLRTALSAVVALLQMIVLLRIQ